METFIISLFIFFFTIERIVSYGLAELNIRYLRKHSNSMPDFFKGSIDDETYKKSVAYTFDKGKLSRWSMTMDTIVTILFLFGGVLAWLEHWSASYGLGEIWTGIVFMVGLGVILFFIGLPLDLISTFRLEQKHGFNKTTPRLYIADKAKETIISIVISIPCLYLILWFMMATGTIWWVWAFCFIMAFQFIMLIIYPIFIAPLFNKFEPIEDCELKDAILDFCKTAKFSVTGVFRMDGSKRSTHSNAYFTGIGKSRRIVLFDTLINEMTTQQAIAVLAHEIGHYKLHHIKKMICIGSIGLLAGLFVIGNIYNYPPLFNAFHLEPTNHAALALFLIMSKSFTFYLTPIFAALSRKHEYASDKFAVEQTNGKEHMEAALLKLTKQNLSNLTPHPWYSAFHYSHPAILERVKAIREIKARRV